MSRAVPCNPAAPKLQQFHEYGPPAGSGGHGWRGGFSFDRDQMELHSIYTRVPPFGPLHATI
jgi:hypothetical protein